MTRTIADSAAFPPQDVFTHPGGAQMQPALAWKQAMARFHRRGLILALALHAALPMALTVSVWWPKLLNPAGDTASRIEKGPLQPDDEAALQAAEAAEVQALSGKTPTLLRLVFEQRVNSSQPSSAASQPDTVPARSPQSPATDNEAGNPPTEFVQADIADSLVQPVPAENPETSVPLVQAEKPEAQAEPVQAQIPDLPLERAQQPLERASRSAAVASTLRKAQLENELKALSERIEAYQRQQDKEQAEQAQSYQIPSEGSGPPMAAPAAKPAPETASRESIIQSRLPVQLKPFRGSWNYKMYYGERSEDSVVALVRLEVELEQDLYVLRSFARPQGFAAALFQGEFTQESRGRVSAWGFRPEFYEEQRGQRGRVWAKMDWEQREVRLSDGSRLPIAQAVQDRLSIAWQLSALANSQLARLQSPAGIQIPLILSRQVELNRFFGRSIAEETIEGKQVRLLKVEREPRPGKRDASIEVWLDVDRDMLPVRMRIEDRRGRVVEQVMQKDSW